MPTGQRIEFLAEVRVAVLGVADPRPGRAPLQVPVWYGYEPGGDVLVQTGRDSLKANLIGQAGRFGLCVQDETAPYRYVAVEGPVVAVDDPLDPAVRSALAHRYLDADTAEAYLAANEHQLTGDVCFRMRPQFWRTADFAKFAAEFS